VAWRNCSPTLRRNANAQTIPAWIDQVDLTTPGQLHDPGIELRGDGLDLAHL
jgi:hypothetical protein